MAKNPQQLNQKQVDVLGWVRDGCPEGVYTEGWEHRIMARALERRGLVTIDGHGPNWTAAITAAGHAWLESPSVAGTLPDASEADRLLERVQNAGGSLGITASDAERKGWERLIRMSLKSPKRPEGQRLTIARIGGWGSKDWEISFVEHFEDFVAVRSVPVPARVSKYHPVVKAYLEDKNWQFVSTEHLQRAARILQAVAAEAERRGVVVLEPRLAKSNRDQPQYKPVNGHLWLVSEHGEYSIEVKEIPGVGGAKRDYMRNYGKQIPRWLDRRSTEFVSTGRLELILDGPLTPYQGQHFRDAKSKTVEDKLPEVFAELDVLNLKAEQKEQERRRQEDERQRRWEAALVDAKAAFARHARWEHFKGLATDSDNLQRYRRFVEAAEGAMRGLPAEVQAEAADYLVEMRSIIDTLDPIATPRLLVPTIPEPSPEQLKPFMNGWNPYGAHY